MVTLFKKFKIGMIAFGAMAFMMMAGWQFGVSGTDVVFTDKEVALENAIAGSGACKWKKYTCPGWGGTSYEACLTNGDGNTCTCGEVTRDC
ncbi:hypothetical protein [Aquiflexum sp.]|uniref:hypothetical protein n=1 Tax=Aquiflexum sp. TaxID=1872584 RepID=UPI0035935856